MKRVRGILLGVILALLAISIEYSQRRREMLERTTAPRDWSTGMKLWLLAALLVILVNMLAARNAYGQVAIVHAPISGYSAITTCDQNGGIVIVVANSVPLEEYELVLMHEAVHASEMKAYPGGCLAFLAHYRESSQFRLEAESRAYCADFTERVRRGMPPEMVVRLAEYLRINYAPGLTRLQVLGALPCREYAPKDGTSTIPP